MTDRVHPSSNPNNNTPTTTTTKYPKLPLPPAKAHLHNQNRHPYRPKQANYQHKRRGSCSSRPCFCLCCFWLTAIITIILVLTIISGCILYLLYRPHRPTFSVTSLKITHFNLTTATDGTTRLTSKLNLTISAKNPNKNIVFYYDPMAITCLTDEAEIAKGYFGDSFVSNPDNITIVRSSLSGNAVILETEAVKRIGLELKKKKKSGLRMKVLLETKAVVKVESFRSRKVGIRIECEGIRGLIPKRGGAESMSLSEVFASVTDAKCEVDLRIKIWKWSF